MNPPATKTRIDVSLPRGGLRLTLTISSDSGSETHELSVADARALSLELIKQAYAAELRHQARDPAATAFPFREQAQAQS